MQYTEEQIEDVLNDSWITAPLRKRFLQKLRETIPQSQPQGFTLQQVSDAFSAGMLRDVTVSNNPNYAPSLEQYLATVAPAPDVKEVSVKFAQWCPSAEAVEYYMSNEANQPEDIFKYWYENIYPGVIEQIKK